MHHVVNGPQRSLFAEHPSSRGILSNRPHVVRTLLRASVLLLTLIAGIATIGFALLYRASAPECVGGCATLAERAKNKARGAPAIFDTSGRLIAHLPGRVQVWYPLDSLPEVMQASFVAVEDVRFYSHRGIDGPSVLRAAWANLRDRRVSEGASTITMQLARTLWAEGFASHNRWVRKLGEVRLARQLEHELTKDEILEWYLNEIYLGHGIYGVGAAAWHYFDRSPSQLDLAQVATLVGMTRTPERYSPRRSVERAEGRRNTVFGLLERKSVAEPETLDAARSRPLEVTDVRPTRQGESYAAMAVLRELRSILDDPEQRRGVKIVATFDWAAQAKAQELVAKHLDRIDGRQTGADAGNAESVGTDADSPQLQASVIAIDSHSGAVRVAVGGRSFSQSQFDRSMQARRQPGSAFKPFVYAAALERGTLTLADRIRLDSIGWEGPDGELWTPRDPAARDDSVLTVRAALARSSNLAAAQVGLKAGIGQVLRAAKAYGIESPMAPYPSTFLGASAVTLAEISVAFNTVANGGFRVTPHVIQRVADHEGRLLYSASHTPERAVDPRAAYLARSALEDVTTAGTGWRVQQAGLASDVVGKTGTSNDAHDLWFVGSTPALAGGVWIGFDTPAPVLDGRGSASRLAVPLWGEVFREIEASNEGLRNRWPAEPEGLLTAAVDPRSGLLVTDGCPALGPTRQEVFLPASLPADACDDSNEPTLTTAIESLPVGTAVQGEPIVAPSASAVARPVTRPRGTGS